MLYMNGIPLSFVLRVSTKCGPTFSIGPSWTTGRTNAVVVALSSYSVGTRFKFRPGYERTGRMHFVIFLSHSRQML